MRTFRQRWWAWALLGLAVLVGLGLGSRRPPTEGMSDDRLFALGAQMKCLQCVGESVANSEAPIAQQMRDEIRTQMAQGRTDAEILSYFGDRYTDRVLLNPPSTGIAGLVWIVPVVAGLVALSGLVLTFRRWRSDRVEIEEPTARLVTASRRHWRNVGPVQTAENAHE